MQAYEGYFENGKFYTAGRAMRIPERRRIYLTVLEEIEELSTEKKLSNVDDQKAFWAEFDRMIDESSDENDIFLYDCFKRSPFMNEPVDLSDEED